MKLYIDTTFRFAETNPPDISVEDLDLLDEDAETYRDLFKRFCIHATVENSESMFSVVIHPQKVSLDDIAMNTLFANAINGLFWNEYTLEYAIMGGEGCEFAMRMRRKENAS